MSDKNNDTLIDFALKIGNLTQGLKGLKKDFENHLKEHRVDRVMQWVIIGLQTLVILFLTYLKFNGNIF